MNRDEYWAQAKMCVCVCKEMYKWAENIVLSIEDWGLRKVDDRRAACAVSLNDNGWTRHIVGRLNPVKYHITPPIDTGSSYCVCSAIRKPTQPFWGLANMIGNHVSSGYISYLLSRQRVPSLLMPSPFDIESSWSVCDFRFQFSICLHTQHAEQQFAHTIEYTSFV